MLIPTSKNVKNITDFRKDPDSVLEAVEKLDGPLYLFRGSEPKAVVLDPEKYASLLESIEDYNDELLALEIEADPHRHEGAITFEGMLSENHIKIPRVKARRAKNA